MPQPSAKDVVPSHDTDMTKRFPTHPARPERVCWGCDRYCAADAMNCGNGAERTQHPIELFGADWAQWGLDPFEPAPDAAAEPASPADAPPSTEPVRIIRIPLSGEPL